MPAHPRDGRDETRTAEAVAVTPYSTVFNSSPKLAVPDVLLFCDAHAGEQYVAEDCSLITGVRLDGRGILARPILG